MQQNLPKTSAWRVTSSPHLRARHSVSSIMLDVIIALIPAGVAGVVIFGWRAAALMLISVASAVIWEGLIQRAMKRPVTINDLSAVVTGLLLAYNLPVTAPLWLPVVGTALAIILIKQCFGGLGQNFMNPALGARAILLASWTGLMSGSAFNAMVIGADAVSSVSYTHLDVYKRQEYRRFLLWCPAAPARSARGRRFWSQYVYFHWTGVRRIHRFRGC